MYKITPLEELKREFSPITNVNDIHRSRLSKGDKIALFITRRVGTMGFFYLCVGLVVIPFIIPETLPIVQYISAGFLQLLLLPLIMIGQNLEDRHSELRAQHEYETAVKSEKEIEQVLLRLDRHDAAIEELIKKIDKLDIKK